MNTFCNRVVTARFGALLSLLLAGVICSTAAPALAQSGGGFGGAILEVVPTTPLSTTAAGAAGTFYLEAQVFVNRTISTADCAVPSESQSSFLEGGNLVGILRIWGQRTGASTGTGTGTNPGTISTPFGTLLTNNITGGAAAVVNMSLELNGFGGTIQMQGTLGRVFSSIQSSNAFSVDVIAVTGGTGAFNGANGEAFIAPLINSTNGAQCSTGAFRLSFQNAARRFSGFGDFRTLK
jgi:hypothetical protein